MKYPKFYIFLIHSLIVFGTAILPWPDLAREPGGFMNPLLSPTYPLVDKFIKWDAHWYTYVAQAGYDHQSIVFFPMIIFLIKTAAPLFAYDYALTGFVICNVFTLFSLYAMYNLFQLDFPEETSARAVLAYALMPTSFFLNSIYTEPIFLTFSLASLYYARTGVWFQAGLFAAFAALTRNVGVFLIFPLIYEYVSRIRRQRTTHLRNFSIIPLTFPVLAVLAVMAYNYALTGDPLAFVHTQKAWGREFSPPWTNIMSSITMIRTLPRPEPAVMIDLAMVIFALTGMFYLTLIRHIHVPVSYLIIGWLWLFIPLCSAASWLPLYSLSRFVLIVFPLYLFVAKLPRLLFIIFSLVGAAGLAACSALFINWHWLS